MNRCTARTHPPPRRARRSPAAGVAASGLAVLVALVAGLAGAPAPAGGAEGERPDGAFLYGRDCAGCHGPDGRGSWWGPTLQGQGAAGNYYVLATGRMPIRHADEPVRRRPPRYTPAEIDALVGHVARFVDGPELPELDLTEADLGLGGELYRLHCGVCHSSTGIGGALAFGGFAAPVLDSEPLEVAAVMAAGTGAMPAFYPGAFTDRELNAIVAYTQQLRAPVDQGGLPFGRTGRVDEALAAWAGGMLALVLIAGWIARAPGR